MLMEDLLVLMGGDSKFYCLQLKKSSGGWPNIQYFFPVGMTLQGNLINGDDFWQTFPGG